MADLKMFRCDRQNMTLSTKGCARLWRAVRDERPEPWQARFACLHCPVGAANAGEVVAVTAAAVEAIRTLCPRCQRRTDRMISGRLCVSCYNREREVIVGANRKGGRPRLTDRLHAARLAVIEPGGERIIEAAIVIGMAEAIIAAARGATGAIAFGRPGTPAWSAP